jgi:hypothetical protein
MPNHKSQRGFFLMTCDKGMLEDHSKLHQCHVWTHSPSCAIDALGRGVQLL